MAKATGQVPEQLAQHGDSPPQGTEYLWGWFRELSNTRGFGLTGPESLRWTEMEAWARLTHRRPSPWEWEVLRQLDDCFRRVLTTEKGSTS